MLNIYTSHPNIYKEFLNGSFTVHHSLANTFGKLEPGEVVKATINKVTKSPGDTTGITKQRFILSQCKQYLTLMGNSSQTS